MDEHDQSMKDLIAERKPFMMISDMDLGLLIFERYYLAAKTRGIVWTLHDLAVRDGLYAGPNDEFDPDAIPDFEQHGLAIEHVMHMEVSYFVFRHLNGPWGEVIDGMIRNRNRFCNEYREKTGYQIDTKQDDLLS